MKVCTLHIAKNFSLRHSRHFGDSPPPLPPGEGGRERFRACPLSSVYTLKLWRNFSVVFILSLASEEWVPKQLKQVSIVGRNFPLGTRWWTMNMLPKRIFLNSTVAEKLHLKWQCHKKSIALYHLRHCLRPELWTVNWIAFSFLSCKCNDEPDIRPDY